ncbi:MAG: hypothetical protein ABH844_05040 [Candidatus Omnitrophota bacterium]
MLFCDSIVNQINRQIAKWSGPGAWPYCHPERSEGSINASKKNMTTPFQKSKWIRTIALIVAAVFLYQQVVWAQGETFYRTNVTVPYSSGRIADTYSSQGEEIIIHLQDAHASLSAQYSIANLLDSLASNYDLGLIALEGAEGDIDTSMLKNFPDKDIRAQAADFLMQEGRMSAGEFFQITHDKDNIALYGAEDYELYSKNLEDFREVISEQKDILPMINAFKSQIKFLEETIYSKELFVFITKSREHKNGSLSFIDYWKFFCHSEIRDVETQNFVSLYCHPGILRSKISGLSPQGEISKNISKLLNSIALEKQINFDKANEERKSLIGQLSKKLNKEELDVLVLKSTEFKEEKISPAEFHNYLKELSQRHEIDMREHKNLWMFCDYMILYESVDIFNLYSEVETMEATVREKLFQNKDEREVYKIAYMIDMLEGLYSVELAREDFEFIKLHKEDYDAIKIASFLRQACEKYGINIQAGYDLGRMIEGMDIPIKFYETAAERDKIMVENTLKRMRKDGKRIGALITGGFHTNGLTHMMKENQVSHLVISPKFEKGKGRPYISVLTGRKKLLPPVILSEAKNLNKTEKYQIAVAPYFSGDFEIELRLLLGILCELHNVDLNETKVTVRRIKDIVIAGIGDEPLLAVKQNRDGHIERIKTTNEHRKIWKKRIGNVVETQNFVSLQKEIADVTIMKASLAEKIAKQLKETNLPAKKGKEAVSKKIKNLLKAKGVTALTDEEFEKFVSVTLIEAKNPMLESVSPIADLCHSEEGEARRRILEPSPSAQNDKGYTVETQNFVSLQKGNTCPHKLTNGTNANPVITGITAFIFVCLLPFIVNAGELTSEVAKETTTFTSAGSMVFPIGFVFGVIVLAVGVHILVSNAVAGPVTEFLEDNNGKFKSKKLLAGIFCVFLLVASGFYVMYKKTARIKPIVPVWEESKNQKAEKKMAMNKLMSDVLERDRKIPRLSLSQADVALDDRQQGSDSEFWDYLEAPDEVKANPYFVERKLGKGPKRYTDVYVDPSGRYETIGYQYHTGGELDVVYGYDEFGKDYLLVNVCLSGAYNRYEYLENGNELKWDIDSNGLLSGYCEFNEEGRILRQEDWDNGIRERVRLYEYGSEGFGDEIITAYDGQGINITEVIFVSKGMPWKEVAANGSRSEIDRLPEGKMQFKRNYDPIGQFVSREEYDEEGNLLRVTDANGTEVQKVSCMDEIHGNSYYIHTCFPGTDQEEERFYYDRNGNCYKKTERDKDGNLIYAREVKIKDGVEFVTSVQNSGADKIISFQKKGEKDGVFFCLFESQKWKAGNPMDIYNYGDGADVFRREFNYPDDGNAVVVERQYDEDGNLINTIEYDRIEDLLEQFSEPEGDVPVDTTDDANGFVNITTLPTLKSLELADKSAYDMRINNIHQQIFSKIQMSLTAAGFVQKAKKPDAPERYISVSAKSFADLRFIGNFIKDKGLSKDQASRFIQVRVKDKNVTYGNLKTCMQETGLDLDVANVKIVTQGNMDLKGTIEIVEGTFGKSIDRSKILIGDTEDLIQTEVDRSIVSDKKSPVYVQMLGDGIASQLLQALIEIAANDDISKIPASLGVCNRQSGYANWYIYLPNIEGIDFDKVREEIENYEKIVTML